MLQRCTNMMARATAVLLFLSWIAPLPALGQVDTEALADSIAKSLSGIKDPRYKTAAFSRIRNAGTRIDVTQLIDYANVKIVRGRRLRVIDRSKLNLILNEQKVQLSEFVSAKKYKELGKLLGVDLFIYGTVYQDALVLKAIDVQTSSIAWADVFSLEAGGRESEMLLALGGGVVNSLRSDLDRLRKANIRQVSFWDFKPVQVFTAEALMDYISVAITKDGNIKVVDRENLKLITREQRLGQSMFIDQGSAKQAGELYGVDAFIYGGVTRRADGTVVASLKMLNIFNGVIEWADLIKVSASSAASQQGTARAPGGGKGAAAGMVLVPSGEFLMGTNGSPKQSNPLHKVTLPSFFIDATEVTNQQYAKFVKQRRYRAPHYWGGKTVPAGQGSHPVVGISWEDARRYCKFMRKRLPKEAEWEKGARGTRGHTYPWGAKTLSPGDTISRESRSTGSVPVNQHTRDISPFGLRFMAGNVREWVTDTYKPYTGSGGRAGKSSGKRVIRGGSWAKNQVSARTYYREGSLPNNAWQDVGFRCAK
ncbi:MAG: SUMF1/EgtB/PvdO family nonheme iron enzyme [SAR324 cluster bacterium]|nr:SUMF1/EgtB/PvdO family nonheme iron enzyme [SAR324 cluster bacterium]